jgi:hypothetical protein
MNPDFLEKLQQITAALRGGLLFNPLDELQKRATQYGEGVGTQLEHDRAQAGYARSHPESMRAQQERVNNAVVLALQMGAGGEGLAERPQLAAAIKTPEGKIVDDVTHAHAYMRAGITDPLPAKMEGFTDKNVPNSYYTRQQAEKLMKSWTSQAVKNQMATRSQQAGRDMGMTTEDVNGKLYANRGTKADEPMTLDDLNRIMAKKKRAALDSVAVAVAHPLADAVRAEGKVFNRGDNEATIFFRGKQYHGADNGSTSAYQDALSTIPHSVAPSAKPLLESLKKNGGFTVDPQTGESVTSGYSVGGGEKNGILLNKPLADLNEASLQAFLNANHDKLPKGSKWGGWVDEKGNAYIEPADIHTDLNLAQRVGNDRGEKALYDLGAGKEIPLKAGKLDQANEWRDTWNKWQSAIKDVNDLQPQLRDIADERAKALAEAYRNPVTPQSPWLSKYTQQDIARPNGASPEKIARVESMAYDTFNSPKFRKWLEAGQGTGNWYDTRKSMSGAIDALGDKLGPQAFNQFIEHLAASTAMSRPENNIRRASWWRALNLQGKLDPNELRTSTLAAPEGMGHIAQTAHHFATADLVQNGQLNVLGNPKPASFAENLKMNWRPVTFDTRMSNATLSTNPEMSAGLAGVRSDATPRKWAYAPIERAAQAVAAEASKRGDLGSLPAGVDPTAAWQAQVWGGIGRTDKTHMMSTDNPSFAASLDKLIARSAEKWGVSKTRANELFWKGQPLDLPLDASLLTGPSRLRKK